jgi:hypothetical protein
MLQYILLEDIRDWAITRQASVLRHALYGGEQNMLAISEQLGRIKSFKKKSKRLFQE